MTKEDFYKHTKAHFKDMWDIHLTYESRVFDPNWLRSMAKDFKLVANNIEELCDVAEMEGLHE